jgi:hypothetical protein
MIAQIVYLDYYLYSIGRCLHSHSAKTYIDLQLIKDIPEKSIVCPLDISDSAKDAALNTPLSQTGRTLETERNSFDRHTDVDRLLRIYSNYEHNY